MVAVAKRRNRPPTGFGKRLRELRQSQGLTQSEVAERIGVHYQAVQQIEHGKVEPNWPTVLKLAEALGVQTDAFRVEGGNEPAEDLDDGDDEPTVRRSGKKK